MYRTAMPPGIFFAQKKPRIFAGPSFVLKLSD